MYYWYNSLICKRSLVSFQSINWGTHQKNDISETINFLKKIIPFYDSVFIHFGILFLVLFLHGIINIIVNKNKIEE